MAGGAKRQVVNDRTALNEQGGRGTGRMDAGAFRVGTAFLREVMVDHHVLQRDVSALIEDAAATRDSGTDGGAGRAVIARTPRSDPQVGEDDGHARKNVEEAIEPV